METLLAPEPSTLDDIYDEERAIEMFVSGHTEVAIQVGRQYKILTHRYDSIPNKVVIFQTKNRTHILGDAFTTCATKAAQLAGSTHS